MQTPAELVPIPTDPWKLREISVKVAALNFWEKPEKIGQHLAKFSHIQAKFAIEKNQHKV